MITHSHIYTSKIRFLGHTEITNLTQLYHTFLPQICACNDHSNSVQSESLPLCLSCGWIIPCLAICCIHHHWGIYEAVYMVCTQLSIQSCWFYNNGCVFHWCCRSPWVCGSEASFTEEFIPAIMLLSLCFYIYFFYEHFGYVGVFNRWLCLTDVLLYI